MPDPRQFFLTALSGFGGILFLLSVFLVFGVLLQAFSQLVRRNQIELLGEKTFIVMAIPGTMLHELSHLIFCLIFRHRIKEVKLFEVHDGVLGHVTHSFDPADPYQRVGNFFIGIAPLVVGTMAIYFLTILLIGGEINLNNSVVIKDYEQLFCASAAQTADFLRLFRRVEIWQSYHVYVWLLCVLLIGSHITLSKADFSGCTYGIIVLLLLIGLFALGYARWGNASDLLLNYGGPVLVLLYSLLFLVWLSLLFVLLIFAAAEGLKSLWR